jgi:methionyl-tRNA synthetase
MGLPDRPDKLPADAPTTWAQIPPGTKVRKPKPLFPRIVAEEEGSEPPGKPKEKPKEDSKKEREVTIDQFDKFDLRAGRILEAERVPNTEKLLKLTVDIGEKRTIVASIGKAFAPEALQDRTVVVIANLKPVRIRGILSEGMLLAAGTDEALSLVTLSGHVAPGEKIR